VEHAAQYTAWIDGRLMFDNTPLPEVLEALGRWYGLRLRLVDSSLARRHLTAVFNGASRSEMLASLASLLDVTPAFMHDSPDSTVITLRARRRGDAAPARDRDADSHAHLYSEFGR